MSAASTEAEMRVVIDLEGGLVQAVRIDGESVAAIIHDYDTEGADPNEYQIETGADGREYLVYDVC